MTSATRPTCTGKKDQSSAKKPTSENFSQIDTKRGKGLSHFWIGQNWLFEAGSSALSPFTSFVIRVRNLPHFIIRPSYKVKEVMSNPSPIVPVTVLWVGLFSTLLPLRIVASSSLTTLSVVDIGAGCYVFPLAQLAPSHLSNSILSLLILLLDRSNTGPAFCKCLSSTSMSRSSRCFFSAFICTTYMYWYYFFSTSIHLSTIDISN